MKKAILLLAVMGLLTMTATAQQCEVLRSDMTQVQLHFTAGVPQVNTAEYLRHEFTTVTLSGYASLNETGKPALPAMTKLVEVALGSGLTYTIDAMRADTLDGALLGISRPVMPAQPSRSKSDFSPLTLHQDAAVYATDAYYGAPVIALEAAGVARDRNLARITFTPIQWNPVTNQVIVVKELTVSVSQRQADLVATRRMQRLHHSPLYQTGNAVCNSIAPKDNHTTTPLRYTIIAYSGFRGELDEFATWKTRQGYMVDLVYTDDANVGSTTSSIKSYLQGLYDNATAASPAPTYVLFVGDIAQVPAHQVSASGESHYSDLPYCCWTSGDYIPDCYYGRLSAQNVSQLTPQLSKTLLYEQYNFSDPSYLSKGVLIAGEDGGYSSDNAYRYCDPAMDYAAKTYVNSTNGYTTVTYYKNNTAFAPTGVTVTGSCSSSSASAELRAIYNQGVGFVNYSAHGSEDEWYKPSLTNSHVSQMTNNGKPMVMIGNCCLTNSMQVDACFGEALLRKGNNAGAVAYIGASNYTYWSEDFNWEVGYRSNVSNTCDPSYDASHLGVYDQLFHTHNEAYSNWYTTTGAIIFAGNMAVEGTTSSLKEYYWQVYHVMGDPSLMPYLGEASTMSATVPGALPIGSTSMQIQAVPYALIGFTDASHNLIASAIADANGNATLQFDAINNVEEYEVVITAQDYQPSIHTVNVIANGPYVSVSELTPSAEMNAGSNIDFTVTLKNMGVETATWLSIEFQTLNDHLLLNTTGQDTIDVGSGMAHGDELTLSGRGAAQILGNVKDQTQTEVNIIVRWGSQTDQRCTSTYRFTLNAVEIDVTGQTLTNNFDSDGTGTLAVEVTNNGHVAMSHATVDLISLDPCFTISNSSQSLSSMAIGQTRTVSYGLSANGTIPENCKIPFIQVVNDGDHHFIDTLYLVVGIDASVITFEDNSWGVDSWQQGDYPWELTSTGAHNGSYCARSRTWGSSWGSNSGNGLNSQISITWTSSIDDSITFWKNVSSESNYDYFRFYIDGNQMEELSGTGNNWSRSAYFVSEGTHTFLFSYEKDYSQSSGSDCAWIDDLHLPVSGTVYTYMLDSICEGSDYTFGDTTYSTENLTEGIYHLEDSTAANFYKITLVISPAPELTLNASATTIRAGESARLTVSGAQRYLWSSGETSSVIDVYPTETTTYYVSGYNGNCEAMDSITIVVDGTIGIDERGESHIALYPNPASSQVTLQGLDLKRATVSDMMGRTLMTAELEGSQSTLDISALVQGIYFIQVEQADGSSIIKKLIKK